MPFDLTPKLNAEYVHLAIDHAKEYVRGNVHTNGLENFWCLLKRCLKGTYVSVEPFHLFRHLDEETFRFNNREDNDGTRFQKAAGGVSGRRLTYRQLIGDSSGRRMADKRQCRGKRNYNYGHFNSEHSQKRFADSEDSIGT